MDSNQELYIINKTSNHLEDSGKPLESISIMLDINELESHPLSKAYIIIYHKINDKGEPILTYIGKN